MKQEPTTPGQKARKKVEQPEKGPSSPQLDRLPAPRQAAKSLHKAPPPVSLQKAQKEVSLDKAMQLCHPQAKMLGRMCMHSARDWQKQETLA